MHRFTILLSHFINKILDKIDKTNEDLLGFWESALISGEDKESIRGQEGAFTEYCA